MVPLLLLLLLVWTADDMAVLATTSEQASKQAGFSVCSLFLFHCLLCSTKLGMRTLRVEKITP